MEKLLLVLALCLLPLAARAASQVTISTSFAPTATQYTDPINDCLAAAGANAVFPISGATTGGQINNLQIYDPAGVIPNVVAIFFQASPGGTYTDSANCNPASGDRTNIVATVNLTSGNCVGTTAAGPCTSGALVGNTYPVKYTIASGGTLYMILILKGQPTFGSETLYVKGELDAN